jgi:glutathione S-transferase
MQNTLKLVSFALCPYVQRAAIVMAEKSVPFERVNVDLSDKPDWFREMSPLGKVPLLIVVDQALFESGPIVEYLDEVYAPALHPKDPLAKARHRAWMEVATSILSDIWVLETTKDEASFASKQTAIREKFARFENVLGDGPWFAGDRFGIVDAVVAPIFRYFEVFDELRDLGMWADLRKVSTWRSRLMQRPSVQAAVQPDYADLLRDFLRRHDGILARNLPERQKKPSTASKVPARA